VRFSATRLKMWMTCPLQAHYRYDRDLPRKTTSKMLFGSIIHSALERYNNTGDLESAIEQFRSEWGAADPNVWLKGSDYASLRDKGPQILKTVAASYRFQDRRVLGTEVPFLVPFGDHELHGYVDVIETQRSGTGAELLKIIDYKTSSRSPTVAELALDIQFTVYHYAVSCREFWVGVSGNPAFPGIEQGEWLWETVAKGVPKRCIWWGLWTGKQLDAGPRTDVDYGRLYRLCEQIAKASNAEIYVPKIGESCTWCDYTDPCAMEIPGSVSALEDEADPSRWL
jgi:RecB family exonuclease